MHENVKELEEIAEKQSCKPFMEKYKKSLQKRPVPSRKESARERK